MTQVPADSSATQMVKCDITGRIVPLDETIELHGRRVCAEGKQILLDRLAAGETLPGEMERSTVLRRFGAMFVDGLIFAAVSIVLNIVVIGMAVTAGADNTESMLQKISILAIFQGLLVFVYFGLMHAKGGQSVGKMAAKIKVVQADGSDITPGQSWLRVAVYQGPGLAAGVFALIILLLTGVNQMSVNISNGIRVLASLYVLVNIIVALADRDQQRAIHDRAASTRVIKVG